MTDLHAVIVAREPERVNKGSGVVTAEDVLSRSPVRESSVLELNDALLSDLERLGGIRGNSVEDVVSAGMGVKEDLETVCRGFNVLWDL